MASVAVSISLFTALVGGVATAEPDVRPHGGHAYHAHVKRLETALDACMASLPYNASTMMGFLTALHDQGAGGGHKRSRQLRGAASLDGLQSAIDLCQQAKLNGTASQLGRVAEEASDTDSSKPTAQEVPFFMYEAPAWLEQCNTTRMMHPNFFPDFAFHQGLESHPWRTSDPTKAWLFVVPAYLGLSHDGECGDHEQNMQDTADMLEKSPHWKLSAGENHIFSAFNWQLNPNELGALKTYAEKGVVGHFEVLRNQTKKLQGFNRSFVAPYGPISVYERATIGDGYFERRNPARIVREARAVARKARQETKQYGLFFMGKADNRKAYKTRRIAIRKLPPAFPDSVLIQSGDCNPSCKFEQTPASDDDPEELHNELPLCEESGLWGGCKTPSKNATLYVDLGLHAKYFLIIKGDSPSTSRFYDGIQFGGVPIIISDGWQAHAMPMPNDLPWAQIAVFVNETNFEDRPQQTMTAAKRRADALVQNIPIVSAALDWSAKGNCIGTMILTHVAREFLGENLAPALFSPLCAGNVTLAGGDDRLSYQGVQAYKAEPHYPIS